MSNREVVVTVNGAERTGRVVEVVRRHGPVENVLVDGQIIAHRKKSTKYRVDVQGLGSSFVFFKHELN